VRIARDLRVATVFLTRLPLGLTGDPGPGALAAAVWCFPLVGLLVGGFSAIVLYGTAAAGFSPWLAATAALATSVLLTGGLHEDGLADLADGLGGGRTRERKLEIMRDSRIGTYGALALGLSLLMRAAALAQLPPSAAAAVLVVAHVGGRALIPLVMATTALARSDGQSAGAGRARLSGAVAALCLGGLVAAAVGLLPSTSLGFVWLSFLLSGAAFLLVRSLARRHLGGYTGDVLGGVEQCGELAVLLAAAATIAR